MLFLAGLAISQFAAELTTLLQASLLVHDPRNNTNVPRTYTKNGVLFVLFRALL
jgi:hypothetical protein